MRMRNGAFYHIRGRCHSDEKAMHAKIDSCGHSHSQRPLQFLPYLLSLSSPQSCWTVKQHKANLIKTPADQTTPLSLSPWKPRPRPGLQRPRQHPKQRSRQPHASLSLPLQPPSQRILLPRMGKQKLKLKQQQRRQVTRLRPAAQTLWNT